jgi:transposase
LGLKVSKEMLKKFLKKLGYTYRRIRKRLKKIPSGAVYAQKLEELEQLINLEKEGFLTIYYADESGFNETPCIPYGWQLKDEPLSIPTQKGSRLNVFGLMSRDNQLMSYATTQSINTQFVIEAIDDFVYNQIRQGRSIIAIDNATIHHAEAFKERIEHWKKEDVYIFYLPTYSPHLNLIETFWRKCKYEWLLPIHFESWKSIKEQLYHIFVNFGDLYTINFT